MSESILSKNDNLSKRKKPREYKILSDWQKKLILEYYPAIDLDELIELVDTPKSTISGIARRNGVKKLNSKADKEKYLKNKKPLKKRAKELELAYQDELDAMKEKEEQKKIEKELQDEKKRQARLKKIEKIVDGYNDEALTRLSEAVTKESIKQYKELLEDGSPYMKPEIERLEDWFLNSGLCLLNGNFIIEECRKVVNNAFFK